MVTLGLGRQPPLWLALLVIEILKGSRCGLCILSNNSDPGKFQFCVEVSNIYAFKINIKLLYRNNQDMMIGHSLLIFYNINMKVFF